MSNKNLLLIILSIMIFFAGVFGWLLYQGKQVEKLALTDESKLEFNQESSEDVKEIIKQSGYCQSDADCVVLESKCPFGCYVSINNEGRENIEKIISNFESSCVYQCRPNLGAKCKENKCVVSFRGDEEK